MGMTHKIKSLALDFAKNESGATAIEYGLIALGIFLAIVTTVQAAGPALDGLFVAVVNGFATLNGGGG